MPPSGIRRAGQSAFHPPLRDHTPQARPTGLRGLGARGSAPASGPRRPGPGPAPPSCPEVIPLHALTRQGRCAGPSAGTHPSTNRNHAPSRTTDRKDGRTRRRATRHQRRRNRRWRCPTGPGGRRDGSGCCGGGVRSEQCLRRGIGRHRDGGGAAADCGPAVAEVRGSHPARHRPRQSRADAAPGVQVVRTVARSTWTPGTTPAPRCVGRRRTGWELRQAATLHRQPLTLVNRLLAPRLRVCSASRTAGVGVQLF